MPDNAKLPVTEIIRGCSKFMLLSPKAIMISAFTDSIVGLFSCAAKEACVIAEGSTNVYSET